MQKIFEYFNLIFVMLKKNLSNFVRNIKTIKKIQPKIKEMYDDFIVEEEPEI